MINMENLDENIAKIIKASYPYIKEFNPAQKAVLDSGYIDDKSNYIIAIPTASGKTVLGVLGLLKSLINGSKAIYAVPLVSIQNEKIKVEEIKKQQLDMLEEISGYSKEKARDLVLRKVEEDMNLEISSYIKERESEAKLTADKKMRQSRIFCYFTNL